jgi:spore coat protein U-like protein
MKLRSIQQVLVIVLLLIATGAQAGSCDNPVSVFAPAPGFTSTYLSANPTNGISTTLNGNCTKTGNNNTNYTVAADAGLSGQNRAFNGGYSISYFVSTLSNCSSTWNAATPLTFSFTTAGITQNTNVFYGCIPTGQSLVPAGTYLDTVAMTVGGPNGNTGTGTFPVSITVQAACAISSAPGNILFTYTAFGIAQAASTSFATTCTNLHPYTIALDSTSGVNSGLHYSLGLNTSQNSGGTISLSPTGTGIAQTFYINGNMAAGQAGTCATGICSGANLHTLTITY